MKHNTIRTNLLFIYSIVILISISLMAVLYAALQVPTLRQQTFSTLQQHTVSVAASVDSEIDQMRTIALNIAYSTMIQDHFFQDTNGVPEDYSDADVLSTLLAALIFPNRPVDQINLYTTDGILVASGLNNEITTQSFRKLPWYSELMDSPEHQLVRYYGTDEKIARFITDPYGKVFISLVMENYDLFHNVCGYIEVKQRLSDVLSSAISYRPSYGEQLFIYDKDGTLLFPMDAKAPDALFRTVQELGFPQTFQRYSSGPAGNYLICAASDGGNFRTVMVVSEQDVLLPIRENISNIILITLAAFLASFALSYFASKKITSPIDEICAQITAIDIEKPASLPPLHTDLLELKALHQAFDQMQSTLSEHTHKLLMLQNQEMQSRMLALQSQMNPHFLFNSLAAIQAMAEEDMSAEISLMCQSMANILRYISSDSSQEVPLEQELRHTRDYLTCMAIRYPDDLSYEIQVPDAMLQIPVPKLCTQLLVENAIKYTTIKRPPYRIQIRGFLHEDHYELHILDNGPGFTPEVLTDLEERIRQIKDTSMLPSLKINGMGILNVFIRYWLLHENQVLFRLENRSEGGARVVIGEYFHESKI